MSRSQRKRVRALREYERVGVLHPILELLRLSRSDSGPAPGGVR